MDASGIHPTEEEISTILKAPAPTNRSELKSVLGLINYYGKFLSGLSSKLEPLHALLRSGTKWQWSAECERVFQDIKNTLTMTVSWRILTQARN